MQRTTINNLTVTTLEVIVRKAAQLAHVDRRAMSTAAKEAKDAEARQRLSIPNFETVKSTLSTFLEAVQSSRKKSGKSALADAATSALGLPRSGLADSSLREKIVQGILHTTPV